jgi:hypothetical protein
MGIILALLLSDFTRLASQDSNQNGEGVKDS